MAGVSGEAFDQDFGSRGQQPNDRMKGACRARQRTEKQECFGERPGDCVAPKLMTHREPARCQPQTAEGLE